MQHVNDLFGVCFLTWQISFSEFDVQEMNFDLGVHICLGREHYLFDY